MELDNVRMLHALQHFQLVVHHLFVSPDILLQDDLDSDLALGAVGFSDNTIRSSAERLSKLVSRSVGALLSMMVICTGKGVTHLRS